MSTIYTTSSTTATDSSIDYRKKHIESFAKLLDSKLDMDAEQRDEWAAQLEQGCYTAAFESDMAVGILKDLDYSTREKVTRKLAKMGMPSCPKETVVVRYPFRDVYKTIYWKVRSALNTNPNAEDLIDRLIDEEIPLEELGRMPHEELDPNCYKITRRRELIEEEKSGTTRIFKNGKGRRGMEIKIPYDIVEEHDPTTGEYIKKEVEVPNGMLTCGKCGMSKTSSYEMQTRSADEPMTIFANCLCCGNRWRF